MARGPLGRYDLTMSPEQIEQKLAPMLTGKQNSDTLPMIAGCLFSAFLIVSSTTGSYLAFTRDPSLPFGLALGAAALVGAYFIGRRVNQRETYVGTDMANRGAELMASDSFGPFGPKWEVGEAMAHWGCMMALWQFIFGNFYATFDFLFSKPTVPQDHVRYASGVIAVVRKSPTPQEKVESSLGEDVVNIRKAISLLLEKNIIREREGKLELPPEMRQLFK